MSGGFEATDDPRHVSQPETSACLIATVRDEGPWLLEWIAHNKAVGFTNIVVASNNCTDGTDAMLDRLMELGVLRHIDNRPPYDISLQDTAYGKARQCPEVARSEWIMFLDADEFLNIHAGEGTLSDLIALQPETAEAIVVSWRLFGDSGLTHWTDDPVCETFTRCEEKPGRHDCFKTLFRNHEKYQRFTPHSPYSEPNEDAPLLSEIVTTDGRRVRRDLFQQGKPASKLHRNRRHWKGAQVNHYIVKTRDVFDLKKARGRAAKKSKGRHTAEFFRTMNKNEAEDRSIQRTAATRADILASFKSDPELVRLHRETAEILKDRIQSRSS